MGGAGRFIDVGLLSANCDGGGGGNVDLFAIGGTTTGVSLTGSGFGGSAGCSTLSYPIGSTLSALRCNGSTTTGSAAWTGSITTGSINSGCTTSYF